MWQKWSLEQHLNLAFSCSHTLHSFGWASATHVPAFWRSFVFGIIGFVWSSCGLLDITLGAKLLIWALNCVSLPQLSRRCAILPKLWLKIEYSFRFRVILYISGCNHFVLSSRHWKHNMWTTGERYHLVCNDIAALRSCQISSDFMTTACTDYELLLNSSRSLTCSARLPLHRSFPSSVT